uniref:Uncharacterized protein n=1 Tax=Anguilla anguilla TaxID=7936 RepID=A0A0E9QSM4_ANGAN
MSRGLYGSDGKQSKYIISHECINAFISLAEMTTLLVHC